MEFRPKTPALYESKGRWITSTKSKCGHCCEPIEYTPITLGVARPWDGVGIIITGFFDTWPCARSEAEQMRSDDVMHLTNKIFQDFKSECGLRDDPESYEYIQRFDRFSSVEFAPDKYKFSTFGGPMTSKDHRRLWTSKLADSLQLQSQSRSGLGSGLTWGSSLGLSWGSGSGLPTENKYLSMSGGFLGPFRDIDPLTPKPTIRSPYGYSSKRSNSSHSLYSPKCWQDPSKNWSSIWNDGGDRGDGGDGGDGDSSTEGSGH